MKTKRLMILGAGVMQGPTIKIARDLGVETLVVDGDARACCADWGDRFERVDLKDREGLEALGRERGIDGVMTAGTDFSSSVAWVAEKLGLPGIPYEAALNASDKARMRRCFQAAGVPSPPFLVVEGEAPRLPALPFACPAVVKPVDNMGGRGCRRVDSPAELEQAVPEALAFSRSRRAIVEAFMDGPEFSVDAIVYQGKLTVTGFADRHIFFPPYFIEMGHTMPSTLAAAERDALLDVFGRGVRALGITLGAAKGDLKLTSRGPMIGEIAARLSGGYMSGWTYPYASGVEPIRAAILLALGEAPPDLRPQKNWTSAERAFLSIPGRVRSVQGVEAARNTAYIKEVFLRVEPGKEVRFPENNVGKCGNVISAAPGRADAVAAAEAAARSVLIRLESPCAETDAFLAGEGGFPPSAFALTAAQEAALAALPSGAAGKPAPAREAAILPCPALAGLRDCYAGRTIEESLDAVRVLTGLPLPFIFIKEEKDAAASNACILGREFWAALVRGGYQGAAYFTDRVLAGE